MRVRKTLVDRLIKKQMTIVLGKGCEGDPNVVSMELVEFN